MTVRGLLNGTRVINARVVRSDLNGEFDSLALELANNLEVRNYLRSESHIPTTPVLLHVLLYRIVDGTLAVSFASLDTSGGTQVAYYGSAWMGVLKDDHRWVTIVPHWISPYEHRGPRSYSLTLLPPGYEKNPVPRGVGNGQRRAL